MEKQITTDIQEWVLIPWKFGEDFHDMYTYMINDFTKMS